MCIRLPSLLIVRFTDIVFYPPNRTDCLNVDLDLPKPKFVMEVLSKSLRYEQLEFQEMICKQIFFLKYRS